MNALLEALRDNPVVYVTRDIERALGLPISTEGYSIVSNSTPFAKQIAEGHNNVLLIDNEALLDTWQLLEHPDVKNFVDGKNVVVFKNSKKIEQICKDNDWNLLNPSATLIQNIEGKVTQETFLPELSDLYPSHKINSLSSIAYSLMPTPSILQYNTSHTGEGTVLIESEAQLNTLKEKFPHRDVRISEYIDGEVFTNNNIVTPDDTVVGNISYQITGLAPYTDNPFTTVGNDWSKAAEMLSDVDTKKYYEIAKKVGTALKQKGWKGLFGIDVLREKETNKMYLIEINARQPQSAVYESTLQRVRNKEQGTIFEMHLTSLLDLDINNEMTKIKKGSQIIDRRGGEVRYIQEE